jgi:hypothetical protein
MWKEGEATKYYKVCNTTVYNAVKRSCKNLGYKIEEEQDTKDGGKYILAKSKSKFKIRVEPVEENITRVKIRIDFMGDKPYAELLYHEIDKELCIIEY